MNKPLISVLIAAYNAEKYLEAALRAVMAQTYRNLEIIIVNDGSQDQTAAVLAQLAAEDTRIRVLHNPHNLGFIASLNKGLEASTGKYIARTDADDLTEPDWIESLYHEMEQRPEVLAMSAYLIYMPEKESGRLGQYVTANQIQTFPLGHHAIRRHILLHGCPMGHPCSLIRSSVFTQHGLRYDSRYPHAEDYKLWFEISKIGELDNLPRPLMHYRLHTQQVSSAYQEIQMQTARRIRHEAVDHYLHTLGLNGLPENITAADNLMLADQLSSLLPEHTDADILTHLFYESLMSQTTYSWRELAAILRHPTVRRYLSAKQKRKLIKKCLRPRKYQNML